LAIQTNKSARRIGPRIVGLGRGRLFSNQGHRTLLGCEDTWTQIAASAPRRVLQGDAQLVSSVRGNPESAGITQDAIRVPEEVSKFAPKKHGSRIDQSSHQVVGSKVRKSASIAQDTSGVAEDMRKFARKKVRGGAPMDRSGDDLMTMLQKTTFDLKTAEERISALEIAIKQWQDRAAQAETQLLKNIQDQIKRRVE